MGGSYRRERGPAAGAPGTSHGGQEFAEKILQQRQFCVCQPGILPPPGRFLHRILRQRLCPHIFLAGARAGAPVPGIPPGESQGDRHGDQRQVPQDGTSLAGRGYRLLESQEAQGAQGNTRLPYPLHQEAGQTAGCGYL